MVPLTLHRHRAPLWLCLTAASVLGLALVQPRAALALEHSLEILGEPIASSRQTRNNKARW